MKVFAQNLGLPGSNSLQGPLDNGIFGDLGNIIYRAMFFVFAFAGFALLLMLISAGFKLLTSSGNPKRIDQGKQQLTYAIVGFFVIFGAFWIVQIAGIILGFREIQDIFQ